MNTHHAGGFDMSTGGEQRPSVLLITSDDQGPWALGCAGNDEIRTPNLDALAASGARFENFFCVSPVCSPARASLFTGRVPSQHGVHDVLSDGNIGNGRKEYVGEEHLLSDVLASAGYVCGMVGKWHLGASDVPQHGFSRWYALAGGMSNYTGAVVADEGTVREEPRYLTDAITDEAIGFLDQTAEDPRPFFLNVNYTAPHSPWVDQHPQRFVDLYADCPFESAPQEPVHPWGPTSMHPDMREAVRNPRPSLAGYYASITAMDDAIGRILDDLRDSGRLDDTMIAFVSDNGFSCGQHGVWGKGNATFPLNMFENSVKVPAMVTGPGVGAGHVLEGLYSGYDVVPTILEFVGVDHPHSDSLVGTSMLGDLQSGGVGGGRESVVVHSEFGPTRMIRTARWKYIHRYPVGPNELYDLRSDPHERRNLVGQEQSLERQRELRTALESWFNRFVVPARDGARQAVTGLGQRDFVDERGEGREPFFPPDANDVPRIDLRRLASRSWPGPARHSGAR